MDMEDRERRHQAMELVQAACVKFEDENHPQFLNYELIEQYLAETAHIDMMESIRLTFFGGQFLNLGWDETSKVHRYVIDVLGECGATYVVWINEGLALMADENQNLEYRKHIAEDVEKLINEAGNDDEQWLAGFWGHFYIKHPLRDDSDPKWLREAEKWLTLSNKMLRLSCELGPHELCELADVCRQRGKLAEAASLYREALTHGSEGCCENTYPENIEARLAMCGGVDSL